MGNKRKFYAKNSQSSNKKAKYMFDEKVKLGPNMKGFLITYNCKFTFLVNEAKKLIQQFSSPSDVEQNTEAKKSNDIEKQLQEELDSLNTMDKQMSILDTGAKYTLFINQPNVDPNQLVESVFEHIEKTKKPLGRFVQRFLPIINTCKSYLDDLEKCIKITFDELDPIKKSVSDGNSDAIPFKYCCVFKTSNNNVLSRDEAFKLVGAYMQSKNKLNKVDFDNPDYVILINVICNLCYLSFVKNFSKYRKYNLIEMGAKFNEKSEPINEKDSQDKKIESSKQNDDDDKNS